MDLHQKVSFQDNVYIHLSAALLMLLHVTLTSNTCAQQAQALPSATVRNTCGRVIPGPTRNAAATDQIINHFLNKKPRKQIAEGFLSR